MPVTDLAICLRRSDYSETSMVLRMMTRLHGQVSLMAKGVKRAKSRFGGPIDLLAVGQAVFTLPREHSVSTLGTLTEWSQTGHYPRLRSDLLRHTTATTAVELLTRLTEELDPHAASFDAMVTLLAALGGGEPPLRRLAAFARTLLVDVGLPPGLERCVNCGERLVGPELELQPRRSHYLFSGPRGGVLCPHCRPAPGESHVKISPGLQDFFIFGQPPSGRMALEITRWLVYYVQHQIGRQLNSAGALERAISAALASRG